MSTEWIAEYLRRRESSPAEFLLAAETMSQNELSDSFHMQKKDVGAILRKLGFDTEASRSAKQRTARLNARARRESRIDKRAADLPSGILEHVETYGLKDASSAFGSDSVNALLKSSVDVTVPHASVARSNILKRSVRDMSDEIRLLMDKGRSPLSIAKTLGLHSEHTRSFILSVDSNYSGRERSPEEIANTALKLKTHRDASVAARLRSVELELESYSKALFESQILELLREGKVPTDRALLDRYGLGTGIARGQLQDACRKVASIDLIALKPIFQAVLAGWKIAPDFGPSELLRSMDEYRKISDGEYLMEFADIYRAVLFSRNVVAVQELIDRAKIENTSQLIREHFPFYRLQSYLEGFVDGSGLSFHRPSDEEIIESRFGKNLDSLRVELSSALATAKSLSDFYSIYPEIKPYHLHDTLNRLSIAIPPLAFTEPESRVKGILDGLNVSYNSHDRSVLPGRRELDFYLPERGIAIEVNPTHTHNSTFGFQKRFEPLAPSYHLEKSKAALERGVRLIHVYDEDLEKPDLLTALLKQQILGYDRVFYGRQVDIRRAEGEEAKLIRSFIDQNHRQGNTGARIYYGIHSRSGELIGAASFSPSRAHGSDWELKRLCFLPSVQIRFGISKVVARFAADFPDAQRLLSYSNLDYGYSSSYESAGFELLGETGPSLRWVSPTDPKDSYSWSVATSWGAKSGVIARSLGSRICTTEEAEQLMVEEMPHRTDGMKGYVKLYRAGSKILVKDL